MKAVLIPVDGPPKAIDTEATLADLQRFVGGYIEAVAVDVGGVTCTGYINEEGKLQDPPLPLNATATSHVHLFSGDYIAGPMIVLGAYDDEGNDTDCPDSAANALLAG